MMIIRNGAILIWRTVTLLSFWRKLRPVLVKRLRKAKMNLKAGKKLTRGSRGEELKMKVRKRRK